MRIRTLVTAFVSTGALAVSALGMSGSAVPTAASGRQVMSLEGFPLDRTLAGLVTFPDVDLVVLVDDVRVGAAKWTTPSGAEPAYIAERRAPTMAEGGHGYVVVSDFTARVDRTLFGLRSSHVRGQIPGGSVGNVDFVAGDEIAPALSAMTGRLLLAGQVVGGVLQPSFAYRVAPDGTATSLLASASTSEATFSLAALEAALARR